MRKTVDPPFSLPTAADWPEKVKNESYFWDNSKRGKKPYVIVQQTLSGCGRIRFQGREFRVPSGSALVAIVPEESAYFFSKKDAPEWEFRWINFEGESAIHLWGGLRKRFGPVLNLQEGGEAGRMLGRLIMDIANQKLSGLQVMAEAAHSVFLSCWTQLENTADGTSAPAARLREMIREQYAAPVNIKQLCAEAGQSREHLARLFKKTYGIEPAAYLRQLRLAAAERYLLRSKLSVAEIARRTGHAGSVQFTRSFIAANGKSPRVFRNR